MNKEQLRQVRDALVQLGLIANPGPAMQADTARALTMLNTAIDAPESEPFAWGSGDGYWIRAEDKPIRPDKDLYTIALFTKEV